jgi:hypothetical protein
MTKVPFITDGKTYITIVFEGKTHTIKKDNSNFASIVQNMKAGDHETAIKLANIVTAVTEYAGGNIKVTNGQLTYKDQFIHNTLTVRILAMMAEGQDFEAMINFMENLMKNPSKTAVMELYDFLEKTKLPITPEGNFLAYKKVRGDYMDIYTGTISNAPGNYVHMPRNGVDDNRNNTCSSGLHFCSKSYLEHYGSCTGNRVVLVEVNPRDVVSIPTDYDFSKGRACKYKVLADITDTIDEVELKTVANQYTPVVTSNPVV